MTETTPKALIDIDGRNLTEHAILLHKRAGVKTVYLAIGHLADKVKDFFGDEYEGLKIKYVVETEPLGTGGWMHMVNREDFDEDFIVMNGDDLSDVDFNDILALHKQNNALVTISLHEIDDPRKFGVADMDGDRIKGFVEKPATIEEAPSKLVNNGYYIFSPEVFDLIPEQKKFMFEYDLFPRVAEQNRLFGYINTGTWLTSNDFEQWDNMKKNWKSPVD